MKVINPIKLFIKNQTDRYMLTKFLRELDYDINESIADEWSNCSMIITDEYYARQFGRNFFLVKNQSATLFFPLVILLPASSNAAAWIEAGYDDVLKIPIKKDKLAAKIKILLRIRNQVEYSYKIMYDHLQIGIYWMNEQSRILSANAAFLNILEFNSLEEIISRNFTELGISFPDNRNSFLQKLFADRQISAYESYWILKNGKKIVIREYATLWKNEENDSYYIGSIEQLASPMQNSNSLEVTLEK